MKAQLHVMVTCPGSCGTVMMRKRGELRRTRGLPVNYLECVTPGCSMEGRKFDVPTVELNELEVVRG